MLRDSMQALCLRTQELKQPLMWATPAEMT